MTLQQDCSIGIKKEVTYGTAVTVDRFVEFLSESFQQQNQFVQAEGLRVSAIGPDLDRNTLGAVIVEGEIELEWVTRGLGILIEAMLGQNTSTLRSGSIYQQVGTPKTSDPHPSYTIQKGIPPVGGGTTVPHTFRGCQLDEWTLSFKAGEGLMLSTKWVGKDLDTAAVYAAPSYTSSVRLLTFAQASISIGLNGTDNLTVPTATVLGSTDKAATANISEFSFTGRNNLDDGGRNAGAAGKRSRAALYGLRGFEGSMTAEFDAVTYRDYYLNRSSLHLVLTVTSTEDNIAGSGTYAALQLVLPRLVLEGKIPESNGGDVIEQPIDFTVGRHATLSTVYLVGVTADTAV